MLTDSSKAFNWIPIDLLIAKLSVYFFSDEALSYIYSYLTRQYVRINNTHSQLDTTILGVPQRFILGLILFNLSINDLFLFVALPSLYNSVDDNTLSAFTELELVIDWLKKNQMIVNPDKFQPIILNKWKSDRTNERKFTEKNTKVLI